MIENNKRIYILKIDSRDDHFLNLRNLVATVESNTSYIFLS